MTHCSPASQAITRASIALKSATTNTFPGRGMNAVRINSDSVDGTLPNSSSSPSRSPSRAISRATDRSGRWFCGRFCT